MKQILDKMLRDSRQYFIAEGLPGRQELLDQLKAAPQEPWKGKTPIQNFFLFEVAPEYLAKAPPAVARDAYCAALGAVPGEWFTPYTSINTSTSKRMLGIEGIDTCLVGKLDDAQLVRFDDSEPHAMASRAQYQVGDLAALMLAAHHQLDYDMNQPLDARKARRQELKKQLGPAR